MQARTFRHGDLTRTTTVAAEAVALIAQGWSEETPVPTGAPLLESEEISSPDATPARTGRPSASRKDQK